jgi:hypothetical protein
MKKRAGRATEESNGRVVAATLNHFFSPFVVVVGKAHFLCLLPVSATYTGAPPFVRRCISSSSSSLAWGTTRPLPTLENAFLHNPPRVTCRALLILFSHSSFLFLHVIMYVPVISITCPPRHPLPPPSPTPNPPTRPPSRQHIFLLHGAPSTCACVCVHV